MKDSFDHVRMLLIDNYDSFTYNLVQYLGELGADVQVHRNDRITVEEIERLAPEKIVISPGPCTPNEAGVSVEEELHPRGHRLPSECVPRILAFVNSLLSDAAPS